MEELKAYTTNELITELLSRYRGEEYKEDRAETFWSELYKDVLFNKDAGEQIRFLIRNGDVMVIEGKTIKEIEEHVETELSIFFEKLNAGEINTEGGKGYGKRVKKFTAEEMQRKYPKSAYKALKKRPYFGAFYWHYDFCRGYNGNPTAARIDKYFTRAIEKGYITLNKRGCDWCKIKNGERGGKAELAVFLVMVFPNERIKVHDMERLFNVSRLDIHIYPLMNMPDYVFNENKHKLKLEKEIFFD